MVQLPIKKHLYKKITQPNCAWLSVLEMGQRSLRTGYAFIPERVRLSQDGRWAVQDPVHCSSCCWTHSEHGSALQLVLTVLRHHWNRPTGQLSRKCWMKKNHTEKVTNKLNSRDFSRPKNNNSMTNWKYRSIFILFFSDLWSTLIFSFYS